MDARAPELSACIERGRRSVRWVAGSIRFAFKVDAQGKPVDVRSVESNVGHRELEACLMAVLAQARFPKPAGRMLTRDFSWAMSVDPAYREAEPLDPAALDKLLLKQSKEVYKTCEIKRRRNRYAITAYVGRRGRITSLGAVAIRGRERARDKLECVLDEVQRWRLPKVKRRSKVTFVLK